MELNILKIDLDINDLHKAILHIHNRLAYMHDMNFFHISEITKIEFVYKTSYGCRIFLKKPLNSEMFLVLMQSLLGSDYMKEVNTMLNHFKFKLNYSNRLFTSKRYVGGEIKNAEIYDFTYQIVESIKNPERKKNYN